MHLLQGPPGRAAPDLEDTQKFKNIMQLFLNDLRDVVGNQGTSFAKLFGSISQTVAASLDNNYE